MRQFLTGRSWWALAALAAVSGIALLAGMAPAPAARSESVRVLPVLARPTESAQGHFVRRSLTGEIVPRRRSELSFEREGLLVEVLVDEGRRVRKGDLLARIDDREWLRRRDVLGAQLAGELAVLEEMRRGPREQEIAAARAEVREVVAQLELETLKRGRRERLVQGRAVSVEEADDSRTRADALRARQEAAEERLSTLLEGTRRERVDAQLAVVARLEAELAQVALDLSKCSLLAPYDGVVAGRHKDEGVVVRPAERILTIEERGFHEARIGVPPELAEGLSTDGVHEVTVRGRDLPARLRALRPDVDPITRLRTAIYEVEDDELVAGEIVRLTVEEFVEREGLWVPRTALRRGARGLWACWVVVEREGGSQVERRDFEVLHFERDRVFVNGTLRAGEHVITRGNDRVVAGQVVEVLEDGAPTR